MSFDEIVSYPQLEKSFLGNSLNQWASAGLLLFALIIAFAYPTQTVFLEKY